jgi:hypothetical protein
MTLGSWAQHTWPSGELARSLHYHLQMSWSELFQSVFTSVQLAVYRLSEQLGVEAIRQLRAIDVALDRLRGAMAKQRDEQTITQLARDAQMKTLALAHMVRDTPARTAVGRLVDLLTSYSSSPLLAA